MIYQIPPHSGLCSEPDCRLKVLGTKFCEIHARLKSNRIRKTWGFGGEMKVVPETIFDGECFFNFCFATLLQVAPMIFVIILFTLHLSVFLITFFLHIPLCQLHLAFIFSHFLALFLSLPYLLSSTCTFFLHSALYTFFYFALCNLHCAICDVYSVPVWIWIWIWWRIGEEGHRKPG